MLFYKIFNKESISSSGWSKVKGSHVPGYNCRHHQWQIFNECLLYLESCVMSVAVVLKWGSFCLRSFSGEHFSMSGDIFNCHSWGWGDTAGTYWAEVRDTAKHLQYRRRSFSAKNYQAQNVNSSGVWLWRHWTWTPLVMEQHQDKRKWGWIMGGMRHETERGQPNLGPYHTQCFIE